MSVQTIFSHRVLLGAPWGSPRKKSWRRFAPVFGLIQGEASFDQAEVISAQLLRIPLERYTLIVLDLAHLTSISSLAMGALVEYRRGLWRRGIEVRLANIQAPVWLALERAGLGDLFEPMELEERTCPGPGAGRTASLALV